MPTPKWIRKDIHSHNLSVGGLIEIKAEEVGGLLLRVIKLEAASGAGRVLTGMVIAAEKDAARSDLVGKEMPMHLCRGEADAAHCPLFAALRAVHVDAMRPLTHDEATNATWMRTQAAAVRADEAALLAKARKPKPAQADGSQKTHVSGLSYLKTLASAPSEAPQPGHGPPPGAVPMPAGHGNAAVAMPPPPKHQPGEGADLYAARMASYVDLVRAQAGLPPLGAAPPPAVQPPPPAVARQRTKAEIINDVHRNSPGVLLRDWVRKLVAAILKRGDGAVLPVVVQYVDTFLRRKKVEPRLLRELENLALAIDYLLEYKDWMSVPAVARSGDVLCQRFKAQEYAMMQLAKPNVQPNKKKKIWLAAAGFELATRGVASFDAGEARAVERDFTKEQRVFGDNGFNLSSDGEPSDSDASSSSSEDPAHKSSKRKKKAGQKKKKRKKAKRAAAGSPA